MTSSPSAPDGGHQAPDWRWAMVCALAGAAVFQFFGNANHGYIDTTSLFYWWGFQWVNPGSETQHGWFILAASAWLLGRNLRASRNVAAPGSADAKTESPLPAAAALLGGLALHAVGFAAQQARISIAALLVFAWGILRLGGGKRWGRAAIFPLGFLVFAIPFNALDSVGFWLRMWVVDASARLAHLFGVGVLQSGTQLLAPDGSYNYDVAAACSGIRSLVALAALSLLAGYFAFHSWWRRALVLALCFPLVLAGNVARILAIVFAAQLGGTKWGDLAHEAMGFGVFAIVLGGILLAIRALERRLPETEFHGRPETSPSSAVALARRNVRTLREPWRGAVAAVVVAVAAGEMVFLHRLATMPARGDVGVALAADGRNPVELPAFIGTEWAGRRAEVTAIEREVLPPDTGFSRKTYVAIGESAGAPVRFASAPAAGFTPAVFLSIVLSGRDRTSIHRPELCLVGQGWTITGRGRHEFTFPASGGVARGSFPATLLRVQREFPLPARPGEPPRKQVVPQLVAYWFVSGDGVVASHWARFFHDAWNRLVQARADRWAYVLVQTDALDGEAAALARMQAVLDGTLPAFQRPTPAS